jgi:hypothetical protein
VPLRLEARDQQFEVEVRNTGASGEGRRPCETGSGLGLAGMSEPIRSAAANSPPARCPTAAGTSTSVCPPIPRSDRAASLHRKDDTRIISAGDDPSVVDELT